MLDPYKRVEFPMMVCTVKHGGSTHLVAPSGRGFRISTRCELELAINAVLDLRLGEPRSVDCLDCLTWFAASCLIADV